MKKLMILFAFASLAWAPNAYAVDKDDDVKQDTDEHIAYDENETLGASAKLEKQFPKEAAQIKEALNNHIMHAQTHDLDAYLADFMPSRVRYPEQAKAYAQRAMALKNLDLKLLAVEFATLTPQNATVHTRQVTSYTDDNGNTIVDDAIISYRWIKDASDNIWKIGLTERRRLSANSK